MMGCAVTIEFARELLDEHTGELVAEILITVDGWYCEGDASVGEGEHLYSERAYFSDDRSRALIDITDAEEDALLGIYKREGERTRDDMMENQWRSRHEGGQ